MKFERVTPSVRGTIFNDTATAVLGYSCCSVAMVLLNKSIAMLPAWRRHGLVLLPVALQNASALVLLFALEFGQCVVYAGSIQKKHEGQPLVLSQCFAVLRRLWPGWRRAIWCFPCSFAFTGMILTSFLALSGMSVPFVLVGKNFSNVLTAAGERVLYGVVPTMLRVSALCLMVLGGLAAARYDLEYAPAPYLWLALNCVCTSAYVLMMGILSRGGKSLPTREASIALNNGLSLILLLVAAFFSGEFSSQLLSKHASELLSSEAICLHAVAGACAFVLNFATMRCISATSATTYAMVGAANKLPTAVVGYLLWRTPVSREGATSLAICLVSTVLYAWPQWKDT
eukprot:TRINITY_DN63927_c0_g1_i1.p1 TRINITY_DN63927_c0_g1~~TRINITY_DN63927_c0_g1_i1.p1  ORF type:complete len:343 (+),score=32.27 TRINITY_DN63927_c0_g1_i1:54-1082(+)